MSKVLAIKGLESFTSAFVGPKIGVESLEDLEEVDDDMMKEIGMTPIQRKKFKKICYELGSSFKTRASAQGVEAGS